MLHDFLGRDRPDFVAMSDHNDIVGLIEAGDLEAARALLAKREAQQGVSGHDMQTLTAMLDKAPPPEPEPQRTSARRERVEFDKDAKDASTDRGEEG